MLTRSQRVSHENLRLRDKVWLDSMETHLAQRHLGPAANDPLPPMFLPSLRDMTLQNRVCVSPVCTVPPTDYPMTGTSCTTVVLRRVVLRWCTRR